MPLRARAYFITVVGAAGGVLFLAAVHVRSLPNYALEILVLSALTVIGAAWSARASKAYAESSLSNATLLAAAFLVGPCFGAVTAVSTAVTKSTGDSWVRKLFNTAQVSLATAAAGWVAQGSLSAALAEGRVIDFVLRAAAADFVYCACNAVLVAGIVSLTRGVGVATVLRSTMAPQAPAYLAYGLYGLLLAVLWKGVGIGPASAILLLVPLWLARWAYAQYAEQQLAYDRTIRTLVQAVEVKDAYTRGHSERVAQASVLIAQQLRMGEDRLESLRYAGILHDVGKLGVPTRLLQKTGRLSDDEFDTIKLHPLRGLEMVRGIEFLQEAYEGILHHHERIDGRGYPLGLSGTDIPEFARIIGVADAFDAMTTTRSYRNARPVGEALSELRRCAGEQFDPAMVEALEVAVTEHGWEPEVALVDLPSTTLPHQPTARDHDDPTFTTDPDAPRELLK
ncbi:MAG: HD-GYP domain-containing protein [Actinomycetales bacterium]